MYKNNLVYSELKMGGIIKEFPYTASPLKFQLGGYHASGSSAAPPSASEIDLLRHISDIWR